MSVVLRFHNNNRFHLSHMYLRAHRLMHVITEAINRSKELLDGMQENTCIMEEVTRQLRAGRYSQGRKNQHADACRADVDDPELADGLRDLRGDGHVFAQDACGATTANVNVQSAGRLLRHLREGACCCKPGGSHMIAVRRHLIAVRRPEQNEPLSSSGRRGGRGGNSPLHMPLEYMGQDGKGET